MSAESMQQQIRPPNYNNSSNSKYNSQIPNYQFMTSQPSTQIAPNLPHERANGRFVLLSIVYHYLSKYIGIYEISYFLTPGSQ